VSLARLADPEQSNLAAARRTCTRLLAAASAVAEGLGLLAARPVPAALETAAPGKMGLLRWLLRSGLPKGVPER